MQNKRSSVGVVWIFSGTPQYYTSIIYCKVMRFPGKERESELITTKFNVYNHLIGSIVWSTVHGQGKCLLGMQAC